LFFSCASRYFEKKVNEEIESDKKRQKTEKWEPLHWRVRNLLFFFQQQKEKSSFLFDLKEQWENLLAMRIRNKHLEPLGCDTIGESITDDKIRRLHILVSLMLSSQTKDTMTIAAMDRLLEKNFTVQYALDIDVDEFAKIIYPVGFWRVEIER